ncbi:MAG: hypothetical protein ABJA11_03425 [Pseudolysinimonas sp.]
MLIDWVFSVWALSAQLGFGRLPLMQGYAVVAEDRAEIERTTVLLLLTTAGPVRSVPSPAPSPDFDANLVTPGVWGFTITAVIMVVVILLIIDMVRRIRRVNYRAEIRQRLEDEAAAASGTAPAPPVQN